MMISNPSNSLEWMVFLAQKYSSMFIKGTWLTLYISVVGTLLGFVLGYIVGIVNDVKLNDGDNIVKKVLIRIVKVIFTVYGSLYQCKAIAALRRTEAASCHCQVTLHEPGGAFV